MGQIPRSTERISSCMYVGYNSGSSSSSGGCGGGGKGKVR